jgi:hypothetical protein
MWPRARARARPCAAARPSVPRGLSARRAAQHLYTSGEQGVDKDAEKAAHWRAKAEKLRAAAGEAEGAAAGEAEGAAAGEAEGAAE